MKEAYLEILRKDIVDIISAATDNYEMGAEPTCGTVADAIMSRVRFFYQRQMLDDRLGNRKNVRPSADSDLMPACDEDL